MVRQGKKQYKNLLIPSICNVLYYGSFRDKGEKAQATSTRKQKKKLKLLANWSNQLCIKPKESPKKFLQMIKNKQYLEEVNQDKILLQKEGNLVTYHHMDEN